jgi:predicted nucleic acid-binding protein
MPFALDASVVGCWALEDEKDPRATAALDRIASDTALVPTLWWFEVRNILIVAERRDRISVANTATFLAELARLPVRVDREPQEQQVLSFARRHRLTAYDAAYLELAQRGAAPLATLDGPLARAARAEHVVLMGHR